MHPAFSFITGSGGASMWDEGVQESWTERVKELYADKMTEAQVYIQSRFLFIAS